MLKKIILIAAAIFLTLFAGCHDRQDPVLSPEAYTQTFVAELRKNALVREVEVKAPLELAVICGEDQQHTIYLDNSYREYMRSPQDRQKIIGMYMNAYGELFAAVPASTNKSRIVPVIKDRVWMEEVRQVMNGSPNYAPENDMAHERLTEELFIVYAEDSEHNLKFLSAGEAQKLNLAPDELRQLAIANFRTLAPEIQVSRHGEFFMLEAGGTFESSLILLDDLWRGFGEKTDGDPVIAVPARNVLLFTGSNNARAVSDLRKLAAEIVDESAYPLTATMFVLRDGRLTELHEP